MTVKIKVSVLILSIVFSTSLFAQAPQGADAVSDLYAPSLNGSGAFTTSRGSSQALSVNPAAGAAEQRAIVDAGYLALAGLEDEDGLGHALSVGLIYPTKYAVLGSSLRLISSPFDSFAVGTFLGLDASISKELYPGMAVGTGLNFGFGSEWTAAVDLGFRHELGSIGMLENFTYAISMGGLGLSWAPSPFTPGGGVSFDFLRIDGDGDKADPLRMGLAADLGFPSFSNMTGKLGLSATIAELITLSGSTGFNLQEAVEGNPPSALPSIGISMNFALQGNKENKNGKLPSDGEINTTLSARPLYNGIWAAGAGMAWTIGVADKKAPQISIDYPDTQWISPNNDGKADVLELPLSIEDQRYVMEWAFTILDKNGTPVRTYRNKERRPETEGVQNIIDRLADVKSGVEIPESLRWDGSLDSGSIAEDGLYYFTISAADDNGNRAITDRYTVQVDNTAPSISVEQGDDPLQLIFSPDGDGNKDTFTLVQDGSAEDYWDAGIYDAAGVKVRSFDVHDGSPEQVVWDGKDDTGMIVPDGIYSYRIKAGDRALNSGSALLENIIVNTEQPTAALHIGAAHFSPNGDEIQDTLALEPLIPVPQGIVSWTLSVKGPDGSTYRSYTGSNSAPQRTEFDGRSDEGSPVPEGIYAAELKLQYRNGHIASALSPSFTLDLTRPSASIRTDFEAFSPNNDGKQDAMIILQDGSDEAAWTGEVRTVIAGKELEDGILIRSFRFSGAPDARISWDGRDDAGRLAADGKYSYRLIATDKAGNTGASNILQFSLSTADTPLLLTSNVRSFSPNGDGIQDAVQLMPQLQVQEGINNWIIEVLDEAGKQIRRFEGRNTIPEAGVRWDGKDANGTLMPDGTYYARCLVSYVMGNEPVALSPTFTLDTQAPEVSLSAPFMLFSPNGDGKRDFIPLQVQSAGNEVWTAHITDTAGKIIRSWEWQGSAPPLSWNGTDNAGNPVSDGTYTFSLSAEDAAGNSTRKTLNGIVLDARIPRAFLTASATAISPNGDGKHEELHFAIMLNMREGIDSWKLEIKDAGNSVRRSFSSETGDGEAPPEKILWDGKDNTGSIREGRYTARLLIQYEKGDLVDLSTPVLNVDISGPELDFTAQPEYFSPDNDGVDDELFITLRTEDASPIAEWSMKIHEPQPSGKLFYQLEGNATPADRIVWDGRSSSGELVQAATDYPVLFTASDTLGNESSIEAVIGVDVLVIREGDLLKIKVPSIIFRENAPDFEGLSADIVDNNIRVLKRIAEILNKFKGYRIVVEGHANPVTRTVQEEEQELQPLSEARAAAVLEKLVEFGVDRGRLSSVGKGGTQPVVRYEDRTDWWKNRRVEFILIK